MSVDWRAVRRRFPVTQRCVYLNTGWSGPSSENVVRAMQGRTEREAFDGPTTPAVRHEKALLVRRTRELTAALLHADTDEVALGYTTTEGINTVLRGIGLAAGDGVIICNLEHNSIMIPAYMARRRDGIDLRIARFSSSESAGDIVDALHAAMTPRTRLLLLSQISFNRGTRLPMKEICEMAHRQGALVAVDGAQSAGHVDVDVREMGCDFLALPGHKWLLGPDGAGALYVRRDHIERLEPLAVAHGANREYDYEGHFDHAADTIHKFELTTHSGPVLAGLVTAIDELVEIGMPTVEARCLDLADRFIAGLQAMDGAHITTPLDPSVRSGIVTFVVREHNPSSTCAAIYAGGKVVMRVVNGRRVRACFHVFNDESDVDRALEVISDIAARGLPPGTLTEAEYNEQVLESED